MKYVIVVDMQNDFVSGSLKNIDAIISLSPMAAYLKEAAKDEDTHIIFTKDTHQKGYFDTQEGKKLPILHCQCRSWGWQIVEDLLIDLPKNKYETLVKHSFGTLERKLKDVEKITVIGTCTDICVISNALILKAKYPEAEIEVISSLCSGTSKEAHEAALLVMKQCQIEVK